MSELGVGKEKAGSGSKNSISGSSRWSKHSETKKKRTKKTWHSFVVAHFGHLQMEIALIWCCCCLCCCRVVSFSILPSTADDPSVDWIYPLWWYIAAQVTFFSPFDWPYLMPSYKLQVTWRCRCLSASCCCCLCWCCCFVFRVAAAPAASRWIFFWFAFISILPFAAAVACQWWLLLLCVATFSIQLYFMFMLHRFTL